MKGWGGLLMTIGSVAAPGSLLMKTSVSTTAPSFSGYGTTTSDVTNLSLMQLQELIFIGACALFVAGAVLFSAGVLEEAIMRASGYRRRSQPRVEPASLLPSDAATARFADTPAAETRGMYLVIGVIVASVLALAVVAALGQ